MDLIRFVILLCMGTFNNCAFLYFDTACLFDSRSDGSHKVHNTVMHRLIM